MTDINEIRFRRELKSIHKIDCAAQIATALFECAKIASQIRDRIHRQSAFTKLDREIKSLTDDILKHGHDGDEDAALEDARIVVLGFAQDIIRESA